MDNITIWFNYRRYYARQAPCSVKMVEKGIEYTFVGCFESLKEARDTAKRFKDSNKEEKIKWRVNSRCIRGRRKIYSFDLFINVQ